MLEHFWITEDTSGRTENFSFSFRVKYNKNFDMMTKSSLPVVNQIVLQKKNLKKDLDLCSDEEKEFHHPFI